MATSSHTLPVLDLSHWKKHWRDDVKTVFTTFGAWCSNKKRFYQPKIYNMHPIYRTSSSYIIHHLSPFPQFHIFQLFDSLPPPWENHPPKEGGFSACMMCVSSRCHARSNGPPVMIKSQLSPSFLMPRQDCADGIEKRISSWWFQTTWKILVKLDHLPS